MRTRKLLRSQSIVLTKARIAEFDKIRDAFQFFGFGEHPSNKQIKLYLKRRKTDVDERLRDEPKV